MRKCLLLYIPTCLDSTDLIIWANFTTWRSLKLIGSAKSPLPCKVTFSQFPRKRMWTHYGVIILPITDPIGYLYFRHVLKYGWVLKCFFFPPITECLCPTTKSDKCSYCKCQRLQRIYCLVRERTEGFIYKHDASFGLRKLNWDSCCEDFTEK